MARDASGRKPSRVKEIPLLGVAPGELTPEQHELREVYLTRETVLRQMAAVEHQALHQQEQNTLLRELIARLVLKYGTEGDVGALELTMLVDDVAASVEPPPELIVDPREDGYHLIVREELRPVEPVVVELGERGKVEREPAA